MKKCVPGFLCVGILAIAGGTASAQNSHDALAQARSHAKAENQRVLLIISGGDQRVDEALREAIADRRNLGKLIKYEYRLAALPVGSVAASHLRKKLALEDLALPLLAILDTEDRLLATLDAKGLAPEGAFGQERVKNFLQELSCPPLDARKVLDEGIAAARESKRSVFVYLSAPW